MQLIYGMKKVCLFCSFILKVSLNFTKKFERLQRFSFYPKQKVYFVAKDSLDFAMKISRFLTIPTNFDKKSHITSSISVLLVSN